MTILAKNRNNRPAQTMTPQKPAQKETPAVAPVSPEKAAEFEARAKADIKPEETARQRLARLEAETAKARAEAKVEAKQEAAQKKNEAVTEIVLPSLKELVTKLEAHTGLTCRALVIRFSKPGDAEAKPVAKMVQGQPGIIARARLVKARKADKQATFPAASAASGKPAAREVAASQG